MRKPWITVLLLYVLGSACCAHRRGPAPPPPAPAAPLAMTNAVWQLTEMRGGSEPAFKPVDPAKYTLEMTADGLVFVRADCSRGTGSFTIRGDQLRFARLAFTREVCEEAALAARYARGLEATSSWALREDRLILSAAGDAFVLEFSSKDW